MKTQESKDYSPADYQELLETLKRCAGYLSRQVEFDEEGEAICGEHIPLLTQALNAISKATDGSHSDEI
jgi:hypothetical protein